MNMSKHTETIHCSEDVTATLNVDVFDGEKLDTSVSLNGVFCITWADKEDFFKKLGNLIDEYRI